MSFVLFSISAYRQDGLLGVVVGVVGGVVLSAFVVLRARRRESEREVDLPEILGPNATPVQRQGE
jgi:hypothetical protein